MKRNIAVVLVAIQAVAVSAQVFRSRADAVQVDVLVTDGRRPLTGLKASDFELQDTGVVQEIADMQVAEVPFSMTLILDTSSSVEGQPLRDLQNAAGAAIGALQPDDRASLFVFGDEVRRLGSWNADRPALESEVSALRAYGSTYLYDAVTAALIQRDLDPGRRNLLILLTDGVDTSSWLPMEAPLDLATGTDVVVESVIVFSGASEDTGSFGMSSVRNVGKRNIPTLARRSGIRLRADQPVLSSDDFAAELAQRTGGDLVTTTSGHLRETFVRIVSEFRSRYVLSYTPRGVDKAGWHPIKVSLKGHRGKVTARRGYER